MTHRTHCGTVVQYNDSHGIVAEVPSWAYIAQRLSVLVLVGTVLTTDGFPRSNWTVMANRTAAAD